ncbi:MAG: hypothetical protein AAF219_00800 [Myxococcota bacterium]
MVSGSGHPPPRPEVTLAVLERRNSGDVLELSITRLLPDAEIFALNMSRDPGGSWSAAVNVTALEGTRIEEMSLQRTRITLGPTACHELQIQEGDSLLICQSHRVRGRSAQSLATVLTGRVNT